SDAAGAMADRTRARVAPGPRRSSGRRACPPATASPDAPTSTMTSALPEPLLAELSAVLDPQGWRVDEDARRAHGGDDSRQWSMPDAVALPRDRDQVVAIVRACRAHRVPVVARGAGTGTTAAAVPLQGGVVVSFARMDRILRILPGDRCAIVEPGVLNGQLQQDRKSTRLNSSHVKISYAVFCLKKKTT